MAAALHRQGDLALDDPVLRPRADRGAVLHARPAHRDELRARCVRAERPQPEARRVLRDAPRATANLSGLAVPGGDAADPVPGGEPIQRDPLPDAESGDAVRRPLPVISWSFSCSRQRWIRFSPLEHSTRSFPRCVLLLHRKSERFRAYGTFPRRLLADPRSSTCSTWHSSTRLRPGPQRGCRPLPLAPADRLAPRQIPPETPGG